MKRYRQVEMLDYFKAKGVKPIAYVYPILAFLAGTLQNNTCHPPRPILADPSAWILEILVQSRMPNYSPPFNLESSIFSSIFTSAPALSGTVSSTS